LNIKAINGFKDILPNQVIQWRNIERVAEDIFHRFAFNEIRLPIMEHTDLFARSIGETTDIVEKEMYTFIDQGITMRPEATASLLRAFIEHGMHVRQPVQRLYTMGPMFRHERPQKGRLRQFHQIDAEVIGAVEPEVDAELMAMGQMLLTELGLSASLEVNSLGCPECRPGYRERLVKYLQQCRDGLCDDCRRRSQTNPLRVLDCKKSNCRKLVADAPSILDSLCSDCLDHFEKVQNALDLLDVHYTINRFMVRGLDYYTRTTFEFLSGGLGAQSAIGAGGRYDGLIEQLGGPKLPGIGFAMGIERLVLLMEEVRNNQQDSRPEMDIFIAALGSKACRNGRILVHSLRKQGVRAAMDYSNRSLKAQMKQAGRMRALFTLILGEDELEKQEAPLRNMYSKNQVAFSLVGDPGDWSTRLKESVSSNPLSLKQPETRF